MTLNVVSESPLSFKVSKFEVKEIVGRSDMHINGDIISSGDIKIDKISESSSNLFDPSPSLYNNLNIIDDNGKLKLLDNNENSIISDGKNMLNFNTFFVMIKFLPRI